MFTRTVLIISLINIFINAQEIKNLTTLNDVQGQLWAYFTDAEHKVIVSSMLLSASMQINTRKLYRTAYNLAKLADKIKIKLFKESHSVMVLSVASSKCLEGLELSDIVKDLNDAVVPAQRCLHDFADIGAEYEKAISNLVAEMRAYTLEAKRTVKFCKLNATIEENLYKPCLNRILTELNKTLNLYVYRIVKIKESAISKNAKHDSITKSCLRRFRRQIVKMKTVESDVRKCRN